MRWTLFLPFSYVRNKWVGDWRMRRYWFIKFRTVGILIGRRNFSSNLVFISPNLRDYLMFILTVMDSIQKMQILSPVMLLSNNDANAHHWTNSYRSFPQLHSTNLKTALRHIYLSVVFAVRRILVWIPTLTRPNPPLWAGRMGPQLAREYRQRPLRLNDDQTHSYDLFCSKALNFITTVTHLTCIPQLKLQSTSPTDNDMSLFHRPFSGQKGISKVKRNERMGKRPNQNRLPTKKIPDIDILHTPH